MADVFEEEAEQTVSIQEYLKNVEEEELEADLVLGGDEGKDCTYSEGYMKRQAIFSCLTCIPAGNAGFCTACSLSCHDGHEIVELWTKRNFRCDCGNSKFGEFYCKLFANKDPENSENSYNHNFKGSYCTCGRPYPDPDAEEQVEMIQCCICEDWFHESHIGLELSDEVWAWNKSFKCLTEYGKRPIVPIGRNVQVEGLKRVRKMPKGRGRLRNKIHLANKQSLIPNFWDQALMMIPRDEEGEPLYEDFICQACADICSFLTLYPTAIWATVRQIDAPEDSTSIKEGTVLGETVSACKSMSEIDNGITPSDSLKMDSGPTHAASKAGSGENKVLLGTNSQTDTGSNECVQNNTSSPKCILGVDLQVAPFDLEKKKPMFLSRNWRDLLCRCETCELFYTQKGVSFLTDKEDTIAEYEKMAKKKRQEKLQQEEGAELNFLNALGHVEKIEILGGIADMKNELRSFLESCDSSKPITSADVHQVFENLAKKRQRLL